MRVDEAGVRRRGWVVGATLAVLVCAWLLPAAASAAYVVDSTADTDDALVGDEICLTGGGKCTLRAAFQEANSSLGEFDEIEFDESVFDGGIGATIALAGPLPTIVDRLYFRGNECPGPNGQQPCVGVSGPAAGVALAVDGTSEVVIQRVAITNAGIGIEVGDSTEVSIVGSWIGVGLDGSAGANGTGVTIGSGTAKVKVGGFGSTEGNLIANSSGEGVDIFGASGVKVLGNQFGIAPDGVTPAPNGKDIEVTAAAEGNVPAVGNQIGTRVEPEFAATPRCDRGCNVISGAAGSGVDLQGDGGVEAPATATVVAGNYVGLDVEGAKAIPNAGAGIRVGEADRTVIGGPRSGDSNRFAGGSAAVLAGPAAAALVVRGNTAGLGASGAAVDSPDAGIEIDSEGLADPTDEALIADNDLRMEGGVAISQREFGAWIAGNRISGAATGIKAFVSSGRQGNLIEGNSIANSGANAILLESDSNEVVGNEIAGSGGAGVRVYGPAPFGVTGNLVGGDSAADENSISGSGGAAIEVTDVEATRTTVARNRGSGNAGLFIDLLATVPASEPAGPNDGIAPPVIAGTAIAAAGTAEPDATVRVFRKQGAAVGEIERFLGSAKADPEGNWSLSYAEALPAGTVVAATQTNTAGATSELALATTSGVGGAGGPGDGDVADGKPPRTAVLKGPRSRSASTTARFKFASDETRTSFECRLDRRAFRACASPQAYRGLRPGRHLFEVRALDAAGNADRSPAKWKFTVLGKR